MITVEQLLLVSGAALVFAVVPGPAVLYIVTRSADQNRRAGLVSGLGVATGNLALVFAAAFGLSTLLASSLAAYLVYLGVRRLLDRSVPAEGLGRAAPQPLSRVYRQGLLVGLLNPKAALFFLSFLPQFAHGNHGGLAAQIVILGTVVVVITLLSDACYAFMAGGIAQALLRRPEIVRRQQVVAGCLYVGLGVVAALNGRGAQKA
jgi:threonine/homoserine/homoserine lactone efflux protein